LDLSGLKSLPLFYEDNRFFPVIPYGAASGAINGLKLKIAEINTLSG